MLESSALPLSAKPLWLAAAVAAGAFTVGGVGGYSLYEHRMAETAKAQQEQLNAQLLQSRAQIADLTSKVNELQSRPVPQAVVEQPVAPPPVAARPAGKRGPSDNQRLKKLQSQLDQQGKAIDQQGKSIDEQGKAIAATQTQLDTTRGDLDNTRTELTGSIARTHDELVLLQKRGERNYYEFDIAKSKDFQREGPLGVRLRKANTKRQYADLDLIVEDRTVSQKHVNLYQPAMFSTPDSPQPAEIVINSITKDRIHGYVSSAKYRRSELATTQSGNTAPSGSSSMQSGSTTAASSQTSDAQRASAAQRQTLPKPQ
jgi:hypothetical protein